MSSIWVLSMLRTTSAVHAGDTLVRDLGLGARSAEAPALIRAADQWLAACTPLGIMPVLTGVPLGGTLEECRLPAIAGFV